MVPLLTKFAGDTQLVVGVLWELLKDHGSDKHGSLDKSDVAAAVDELFTKLAKFLLSMEPEALVQLHDAFIARDREAREDKENTGGYCRR